jgi:uncharacterized protein YdeI (YjbR/CyaY-like superfamily)
MQTDPRIDAYIAKSADFAKPILTHIREVVHSTCPEGQETMKWSFPHFLYKGMLCSMAAFKEHCALGFWKGDLVFGKEASAEAMGHFGRIKSLADLPSAKKLAGYIKKAMELNEQGVKLPARTRSKEREPLVVPPDLKTALAKNKKAQTAFEDFSYSHKKEYIEWITEAKRPETRTERVKTTVKWLSEGKSRNWKYEKC